jgi:hypothetical protein
MTTDYALINRKVRIRTNITTADSSAPGCEDDFVLTKGCSYIEVNVNGLSGSEKAKIRPYFLETVDNSVSMENYVSCGAELELSLTNGNTCNISGVNGRPVYIMVTELTGGASINIDLAPGRVPPGLNI